MIKLKKSVLGLPVYEVPQQALVKLNQNESPYDIPAEFKNEIMERMKKYAWNRYPAGDNIALKKALSHYTDCPYENIIAGNGSNELILAVMLSVCDKGDNITLVSPGFAIYAYCARLMNLCITEVPLKGDFSFNVSALYTLARKTKLMCFASPNNPTGTTIDISAIEEIVKLNQCLVVVDEAYFEFHKSTAQHLVNKYKNVLILRTFSKAFSFAGLRLGYLIGNKYIVAQIEKAKLPFSVGIFQQVAGGFLLGQKKFVLNTVNKVIKEREKVMAELELIPDIEPIPSRANFILFTLKKHNANEVFQALYKKGILVRKFNHPSLDNKLRVTIGKPEENQFFLKSLLKFLEVKNA